MREAGTSLQKYVNRSLGVIALVPLALVTVTSTVPDAALSGVTAVIVVSLTIVKLATTANPTETEVALANPGPVIEKLVVSPSAHLVT